MTTVQDILEYVENLAPLSYKMDWDNVGFQCGSRSAPVRKILVALDPFEHVCHEASEVGADLLLTHHPLIFRPLTAITDDNAITRGITHLCANGISSISAHTNLDCAEGGVNDVLAQTLGLKDVEVIGSEHLLRAGCFDSTLEAFLNHVKSVLGCAGLRYVDAGKPVHRVAVGGGSCSGGLQEAIAAGCDTFVTADVNYNAFWDAQERGISLIDAGHFYTENPVCAYLAEKLRTQFPNVIVEVSKKHKDCMKFF